MTKPKYWHASIAIDKRVKIGRLDVHLLMKKGDGCMGRLGGGWLWKLGILAGSREIVLELFVLSIRFTWVKKEAI